MRFMVVGGTGHIGIYLVPRLVQAGHHVLVIARQARPHYGDPRIGWGQVEWLLADRTDDERTGAWRTRLTSLEVEAVVDLICYITDQNQQMFDAFRGRIAHFLHCGTIWAYGPTEHAPYEEHFPRKPIGAYGIDKARIEAQLMDAWRRSGFPATVIHPGHIGGRG
ncbi:MAG: NAD-dependent epimerase/dehydratase family protein [Actinobacteria bacterium]|nr:NAD-dependent epimerase/dehydratase family protein [Actinomycetota bacterium]